MESGISVVYAQGNIKHLEKAVEILKFYFKIKFTNAESRTF
jgi:hypothetical protein